MWAAYGTPWDIDSESDCVEYLMELYNKLVLLSNKIILKTSKHTIIHNKLDNINTTMIEKNTL